MNQLTALGKAKEQEEAYGEIETEHSAYLGAQGILQVWILADLLKDSIGHQI